MDIARARLSNHLLGSTKKETPGEVVAWLGAVQAQDYAAAKWALGLRLHQATDGAIERAFNEGAILRTHVMRPTWHFLTPQDIRWVQALCAPRAQAGMAAGYRKLELDGRIAGTWKRVLGRGRVGLHARPFRKLQKTETEALEQAAARYAAFLQLPLSLRLA